MLRNEPSGETDLCRISQEPLFCNGEKCWHCHGNPDVHSSLEGQSLIDMCKAHLPQVDIKHRIGSTGYIHFIDDDLNNCWTTDQQNRLLVIINNVKYFQRYSQGQKFMKQNVYGSWDPLDEQEIPELIQYIKS